MNNRDQIIDLADRLDRSSLIGGELSEAEAKICAEALRRFADDETRFEVAAIIEKATGHPWHEPTVLRAAASIARLYERAA